MHISSINLGTKKTINFNGEAVETGIFKSPVEGPVHVNRLGVDNDVIVDGSVHGGADQAVYLYSIEDYAWWASEVGEDLTPGTFGENITTRGLNVTELTIGDRLIIGEVELEITAPRTPCFKLATRMDDPTFAKQFVKAGRPGAYARVLKEGTINANSEIILEKTKEKFASILDVFKALHEKNTDPKLLLTALKSPIGENHKKIMQALYDAANPSA